MRRSQKRNFLKPIDSALPFSRWLALASFAEKLEHVAEPRWTEEAYRRAAVVVPGGSHAVLLEESGSASALGDDSFGQLQIPAAPCGVQYVAAAAGTAHTVLLRSREAAFGLH